MKFRFAHNNLNVLDLERSLAFYREALGLQEVRRKQSEDGSFTLVFLGTILRAISWSLPGLEEWNVRII